MQLNESRSFFVAFVLVSGVMLARPAEAQVMSFSFYSDAAVNESEDTLFTVVDGYDNSSGCDHSGYETYATLSAPSGWMQDYFYGLSAEFSAPIIANETYSMGTSSTFWCSCINSPQNAGGGGASWIPYPYIARYQRWGVGPPVCPAGVIAYQRYNCNIHCQKDTYCWVTSGLYLQVVGVCIIKFDPFEVKCSPGVPNAMDEEPNCDGC